MVKKTFCDLCGKELIDMGEDVEHPLAEFHVSEFISFNNIERDQVWDNFTLLLCAEDYAKLKKSLKRVG